MFTFIMKLVNKIKRLFFLSFVFVLVVWGFFRFFFFFFFEDAFYTMKCWVVAEIVSFIISSV